MFAESIFRVKFAYMRKGDTDSQGDGYGYSRTYTPMTREYVMEASGS